MIIRVWSSENEGVSAGEGHSSSGGERKEGMHVYAVSTINCSSWRPMTFVRSWDYVRTVLAVG